MSRQTTPFRALVSYTKAEEIRWKTTRSPEALPTLLHPPTMMDTPSKAQEGRVVVTAFMFESAIIVMRNMLVIILFAREKKLRKKSLFLVMNMAVADTVLGAVALPLHVYLTVGPEHEFIFHFLDTTFSQSSLISAGFISCERFYAVFWPQTAVNANIWYCYFYGLVISYSCLNNSRSLL